MSSNVLALDDSDTDEGGDNGRVEVMVIRSADGTKSTFSIPLSSTTLNNLKDTINKDPNLGPLNREQQRIFHLGRELKTGKRSLQSLGIGKFNVFSVHLHSLRPKTYELGDDDDDSDGEVEVSGGGEKRQSSGGGGGGKRRDQQQQQQQDNKVVELLDSDSDDDDVVEVVEATDSKRRKMN
eukprot:scaffold4561_cov184-Alexandrium_tamarense.AAC.7